MGKLDDTFDVVPVESDEVLTDRGQSGTVPLGEDANAEDTDFDYTRGNQIELIEISKSAVKTAVKIAVESEKPVAIEALAVILKTASEMNRQLVQMSKDRAEVKTAKKEAGTASLPNHTNNTIVFTGSMEEALAKIKELKQ